MSSFYERYDAVRRDRESLLCVGLDPDPDKLPPGYDSGDIIENLRAFLGDIISSTAPYAVAYKPNLAFYEVLGSRGMALFEDVITMIREAASHALIIADAKRGDIGNTASFYAKAFFETYNCDAITLSPYMGLDSLAPFLADAYADRAVVVLCHTSNPGAPELQDAGEPPLYLRIATKAQERFRTTGRRDFWLVVGATRDAGSIATIRKTAPNVPFLVPGVGAQGGNPHAVLRAAGRDVLINAGRALLYAAPHRQDVPASAEREARSMLEYMREYAHGS